MSLPAIHEFWQRIEPAGTYNTLPTGGFERGFPAMLPDGRQLLLPIRATNDGLNALASLIINQASFQVVDSLASMLADRVAIHRPEIVVGLPTLGITLAESVARSLGHTRFVPLGTSKKFWYDNALSEPMRSITSPGQQKQLYIDPRMIPLLEGRRVLLIDDVFSTGSSIAAALRLLRKIEIEPCATGAAMLQTERWKEPLSALDPSLPSRVIGVFQTPLLAKSDQGGWEP